MKMTQVLLDACNIVCLTGAQIDTKAVFLLIYLMHLQVNFAIF